MRVLLASSELHPYSKTGGLADMVAALGKYLAKAGHEVSVFTPLYRGVRESAEAAGMTATDARVEIPLAGRLVTGNLHVLRPQRRLTVYFVEQDGLFDRDGVYDQRLPHGRVAYADNFLRFVFFSRAVVQWMRDLELRPQIVHGHDWQTGLMPLLVRHRGWYEGWEEVPKSVFTIHNLGYPGRAAGREYALTGLPAYYFHPEACEYYGDVNPLKAGIVFADAITTVSPRYAREITTPLFGAGLDGVLRSRQSALTGILNGVDYEDWNTTSNPHLPHPYSVDAMDGKRLNKLALQREVGLPEREEVPLFGTVSRLADQKGIDLIVAALNDLFGEDLQYVLLGSGDELLEEAAKDLVARFPGKMAFVQGRNERLAHLIEAGCDFFVMPSRYEPCGLNQLYSLRFGTPPIVCATGGLDDSVVDAREDETTANGIKFHESSVPALAAALRKALALYAAPEALAHYRRNGMQADFGWRRTVKSYVELYRRLAG
ncbi:MAG: glycogen synthase GlgA [Verrucomicrobiales bacterium]|nr:glycogen synthase GlgA [Verrucomicrobiales bacterium]